MNSKLKLVIGDKNLSSWSMRAWLAAKASGLEFDEVLVRLDQPETKAELKKHSPSQRVPCLIYNGLAIWDSLAICELLAELSPDSDLWPQDVGLRALARSYVAEMHSGFASLRSQLSMDIRLKMQIRHLTPDTIRDIERILALWTEALQHSKGPFLFGKFSLVDCFYAPVVFRFLSYGVQIESEQIQQYMSAVKSQKFVAEWASAALNENYKTHVFG